MRIRKVLLQLWAIGLLFVHVGLACAEPQNGWWWNEAESGSGYSVEIQGSNAFVIAFMYDDGGNPVWYFTAGPMTTPTHYEGDWLQFAGGQTLTGPYRRPGTPQKPGRVTIDFTTAEDGTITFTEVAATKGDATVAKPTGPDRRGCGRSSRVIRGDIPLSGATG